MSVEIMRDRLVNLSLDTRLWYLSSSEKTKHPSNRARAAIQYGKMQDSCTEPSFRFILNTCEQLRLRRDCMNAQAFTGHLYEKYRYLVCWLIRSVMVLILYDSKYLVM